MSIKKRKTVVFNNWKKYYISLGKNLDTLEETYDAFTTYPRRPGTAVVRQSNINSSFKSSFFNSSHKKHIHK
jgi:hypothetical protein